MIRALREALALAAVVAFGAVVIGAAQQIAGRPHDPVNPAFDLSQVR